MILSTHLLLEQLLMQDEWMREQGHSKNPLSEDEPLPHVCDN